MKTITILQPWATLIALGEKRFETRSWSTSHRGPLAIHAGKQIDREACEREPIKSTLAKWGYTADNLPTGAVLAVAQLRECWKWDAYDNVLLRPKPVIEYEITGVVVNHKVISKTEKSFGWYEHGRFAWEMTDVKQLAEPIPAKGQQRLWNWEAPAND